MPKKETQETPKWGSEEAYNLSERMAKRARLLYSNPPKGLSEHGILQCVRNPKATMAGKYVPAWFKNLDLTGYKDAWNDWMVDELSAIEERLINGIDYDILQDVFSVPEQIMGTLRRKVTKQTYDVIDERKGFFSTEEIPDGITRREANKRWNEFSEKINLSNPINQTMIRSLINTEIQMKRLEFEMMTANPQQIRELQVSYDSFNKLFSKLAEDIASLERQQDIRPVNETFDAILARHDEIKQDWRDISTQLKMEEEGLIKRMVELHKIDLKEREEHINPLAERMNLVGDVLG
jgi:hypothetical protein